MKVNEYQELYEGLTQEDVSFRDTLYAVSPTIPERSIFSELDRVQNRLNHAMLGVYPLYRREVELSGMVDYTEQTLRLFAPQGEQVIPFDALDDSYVSFLEAQQAYQIDGKLPLSSLALKVSNQWLSMDGVTVPDLANTQMHLPSDDFSCSRKVLEVAFARNMVLMNHLHHELQKNGLDTAYGVNRADLLQYCETIAFDYSFNHSVNELTETAQAAAGMNTMEKQ